MWFLKGCIAISHIKIFISHVLGLTEMRMQVECILNIFLKSNFEYFWFHFPMLGTVFRSLFHPISSVFKCHLFVNTLYHVAHEIRGEPSTEYSSGQPQCSTHGQRLREHCPRFPCRGILQCWWSPYEMNDEKTGSLVHTLFIQGCPGSFTCLSIEHWVQGTL